MRKQNHGGKWHLTLRCLRLILHLSSVSRASTSSIMLLPDSCCISWDHNMGPMCGHISDIGSFCTACPPAPLSPPVTTPSQRQHLLLLMTLVISKINGIWRKCVGSASENSKILICSSLHRQTVLVWLRQSSQGNWWWERKKIWVVHSCWAIVTYRAWGSGTSWKLVTCRQQILRLTPLTVLSDTIPFPDYGGPWLSLIRVNYVLFTKNFLLLLKENKNTFLNTCWKAMICKIHLCSLIEENKKKLYSRVDFLYLLMSSLLC
jgi:hypothetical protein